MSGTMKKCEWCGGEFVASKFHPNQRFCGGKCMNAKYLVSVPPITKLCEYCGKEFVIRRYRTERFCGRKCSHAKWHKEHPECNAKWRKDHAEERRQYNAQHYKEHSEHYAKYRKERVEEIRQHNVRYYDSIDTPGTFLRASERSRARLARLKQDPEKYAQHLARHRERNRAYSERKKKRERNAAWLADPINKHRADAREQMTAKQRAADDEKLDRLLDARDRKAKRDAIKRDLAVAAKATEAITDPTWADLEWSPDTGTK